MSFYMGREIPPIMQPNAVNLHCLTRGERSRQEQTHLLLNALGIQYGMAVADIGAGTGFITIQVAHYVGPDGYVVASELQPEMLDILANRSDLPENVYPVLATPYGTDLPRKTFDLILLIDSYHEAPRPDLLLRELRRALKPNGRLALVEYRQENFRFPMDARHAMNAAQAVWEFKANGFRLVQQFQHLPHQHLLIFKKAR